MRILMSAAASAAAISIIKHLQTLGHKVIGIDANENSKSIAMHFCDDFYLSPLCSSSEFIPFINQLDDKFDLYIPFIDEELIILSQSSDLSKSISKKILINSKSTISICTSKVNFQLFCEENNLPVAPTSTSAPAIFKPEYGRGGKGIYIIEDDELFPFFKNKKGVIQTLLKGTEYTVDVLVDSEGDWVFGLARKRLEAVGVSRVGEINQHPLVLTLAKKCVEKIRFNGPINIQIMLDEDRENAHIIEINPRLSGSLIFSINSGFDIVDLSIKSWLSLPYQIPLEENISDNRLIRYWQEHIC